jgi:hypothetical protein
MRTTLYSVTGVCQFPEKAWLAGWVVKLMKGEYPAWAAGTEPTEVRLYSQHIGNIFHLLVEKDMGGVPNEKAVRAADKASLEEGVSQRAFNSFRLWKQWRRDCGLTFEQTEYDLTNENEGVSARCDAIARDGEGFRYVVEWKTGNELRESDAMELSAYCWLAGLKYRQPVNRGLLVHVPYDGKKFRVVELQAPAIIHGAQAFNALLQAKKANEDWNALCHTGLKVGFA